MKTPNGTTFTISDEDDNNNTNNVTSMSSIPRRSTNNVTVIENFDEIELGSMSKNGQLHSSDSSEHDQLPNVEQYKASVRAMHGVESARRRFKLCCAMSTMLVTIFIVLGVKLSQRHSETYTYTNSNDPNQDDVTDGSGFDTNAIKNNTYNQCSDTEVAASRFTTIKEYVIDQKWSSSADFKGNDVTPQSQAVLWLASLDPMCIDMDDILGTDNTAVITRNRLLQRYVLSVLYYTLGGTGWTEQYNFLSEIDVCSWTQYVDGTLDNVTQFNEQIGIVCITTTTYDGTMTVPMIERIYLPSNNLKGTIPTELRLLYRSLKELNFYNNEITGQIPVELQELTNLEALVLYQNNIDDVFPIWLSSLSNLQVLNIGDNNIQGNIPANLNQNTLLEVLNCESCLLDGPIAPLLNMTYLQAIHLGTNELTGILTPELVASWPNLLELDFGSNHLQGTIPSTVLTHPNLMVLDLHSNMLTGPLLDVNTSSATMVDTIFANNNLRVLAVHDNMLTGKIHDWIYALTKVQHLDLSSNQLTGSIPTEIAFLNELKYFFVNQNPTFERQFIPTEIGKLTNLIDVSFQDSNRAGPIPPEIGNLHRLVYLDLIGNHLEGSIPREIGLSLPNLRFLLLRNNSIVGEIPDTFAELLELDTILLDSNEDITDGMNYICYKGNSSSLREVTADCSKLITSCKCCTKCCDDSTLIANGTCTNPFYSANFDPVAEYRYVRRFYRIHEDDVAFNVASLPNNATPLYDSTDTTNVTSNSDPSNTLSEYAPNDGPVTSSNPWEEYLEDLEDNTADNGGDGDQVDLPNNLNDDTDDPQLDTDTIDTWDSVSSDTDAGNNGKSNGNDDILP